MMELFRDAMRPLAVMFRRALHQRAVPPDLRMCMECMGGGEINGVVCRGCHGDRYVEVSPGKQPRPVI
jgi:hypothetical protein